MKREGKPGDYDYLEYFDYSRATRIATRGGNLPLRGTVYIYVCMYVCMYIYMYNQKEVAIEPVRVLNT